MPGRDLCQARAEYLDDIRPGSWILDYNYHLSETRDHGVLSRVFFFDDIWSTVIIFLQSYRCGTEGGSRCDVARVPGNVIVASVGRARHSTPARACKPGFVPLTGRPCRN